MAKKELKFDLRRYCPEVEGHRRRMLRLRRPVEQSTKTTGSFSCEAGRMVVTGVAMKIGIGSQVQVSINCRGCKLHDGFNKVFPV